MEFATEMKTQCFWRLCSSFFWQNHAYKADSTNHNYSLVQVRHDFPHSQHQFLCAFKRLVQSIEQALHCRGVCYLCTGNVYICREVTTGNQMGVFLIDFCGWRLVKSSESRRIAKMLPVTEARWMNERNSDRIERHSVIRKSERNSKPSYSINHSSKMRLQCKINHGIFWWEKALLRLLRLIKSGWELCTLLQNLQYEHS